MNRGIMKILDLLFFTRPILIFPCVTLLLLATNGNSFGYMDIISYISIMGCSYILNQIYDIENDKINGKNFHLSKGILTIREGYILFTLLTILSFNSIDSFESLIIKLLLYLSMVVFYNLPLFNWKGDPYLTLLSSFLGGSLTYLYGVVIIEAGFDLLQFFNYGIVIVVGSIFTMVPDIEGDREDGKITFAVKYGERRGLIIGSVINLIGVTLSLITEEYFLLSSYLFTLILIFLKINCGKSAKILILLLTGKAVYLYPSYLIFIGLAFGVGRFYYKKRFGIKYP